MLTYILIALAIFFAVILVAAALRPDELHVERTIAIAAPSMIAFAQINDLRKWREISPYVKYDPTAKHSFAGPTAGIGSSIEWAGNSKLGSGRMTIIDSQPHDIVRFKCEFFKPWYCTNTTDFVLRPSLSGTDVTWAMSMRNNFVAKVSGLFLNMDKLMGEGYEEGLLNLKKLAEAAVKET